MCSLFSNLEALGLYKMHHIFASGKIFISLMITLTCCKAAIALCNDITTTFTSKPQRNMISLDYVKS